MNRYLNILAFLTAIVVTARTTDAAEPSGYAITNEARMTEPLMKGAELYCWQTYAGEWNYALLRGTNLNSLSARRLWRCRPTSRQFSH